MKQIHGKAQITATMFICMLMGFAFFPVCIYASNLSVSDITFSEIDTSANTAKIRCNISWDYAWRNDINHDAVWLFVKYRTSGGNWAHATLTASGTNPSGFSSGTESGSDNINVEIVVPSDKKGCFIRPAANTGGDDDDQVNRTGVTIVWDYGFDGVSDTNAANVSIRVFGIEMVYIPTGGFYAGDYNTSSGAFVQGSSDTDPWYISSENSISVENVVENGYYYQSSSQGDGSGAEFIITNSFPKGYAAFYIMKYKLSQGMYRDFLNSLTAVQKDARVTADLSDADDQYSYVMVSEGTMGGTYRQTIKALPLADGGSDYTFVCDYDDDDLGNESGDGEWIAMNYIDWSDVCAFADWAALRPLTELEYEKACRGADVLPVAGEYAWGTADIVQATTYLNEGEAGEMSLNVGTDYACVYGTTGYNGPLRSGYAATSSTDRESSGATYYGVLDMTGNIFDQYVTVGDKTGRAFLGTHGNGELTSGGYADIADWPGYDGTTVSAAGGTGWKCGTFNIPAANCAVSDRIYADMSTLLRYYSIGARLGRSAP